MSTFSNLLGIDSDVFAVVTENPDALKSQSNTVRLQKDKRVKVKGSIENAKIKKQIEEQGASLSPADLEELKKKSRIEIPTYITLESAYWTRLTVRNHEVRRAGKEPRISQVFGGVFKPVKMKVEVELGGQTMPLQELIINLILESSNGKSRDEVMKIVEDTNLIKGFKDGMPLMFQQMGASENGFAHAIEIFKAAGGIDDLASLKNNPRFHTCYDMKSQQGLEVVSFELGSADRSQSTTGQGFIDIVDAVFSNLIRVISHKSNAAILKKQIEEQAASLSQADIKANQLKIDTELAMSRQYPVIWSGASRQVDVQPTGDKLTRDKYNATNAPCGRWTVVTANGNVDLDVWSNSENKPSNTASVAQVDKTKAPF